MRLITLERLLVAVAFVAIGGAAASAQDTIDIRVPFDFVAGGRAFHAGAYVVTVDGNGVMLLRANRGNAAAFVLTMPASGHDPAGTAPALVFNRIENRNVLSQVWEDGFAGREIVRR